MNKNFNQGGAMSALKNLALTLALLALLASNAAAQCGGKTVYIELPAGWGNSIFILLGGNFREVSGITKSGNWTVFTFPQMGNDGATANFTIANDSAYYKQDGMHYITRDEYASGQNLESNAGISCSALGPENTYISENPANPGKTTIGTNPPDVYYLYFLPPNDPEWIMSTPYIRAGNNMIKMDPAEEKCGWFVKVFSPDANGPLPQLPAGNALIWPGLADPPKDQIGLKGWAEDQTEWVDGNPTHFNLKTQFDAYGVKTLYFVSDGDDIGWHANDPFIVEKERCNYSFAAFIYHRGKRGNSFSTHGTDGTRGEGICPGYVQETLGADSKMQWRGNDQSCASATTVPNGVKWQSKEDFENAFKSTPGQNVQRCYDMPFQKRPSGLWEFDASYLCPDGTVTDYNSTKTAGCGTGPLGNGGPGGIGGFYLKDLTRTSDRYGDYTADYAACGGPMCGGTTYAGNSFLRVPDSLAWCFDRGWYGKGKGNLDDKNTKTALDAEMDRVCTGGKFPVGSLNNYDEGAAGVGVGNATISMPGADWEGPEGINGFMCFESAPADFTYEKGQEFFFRGDDDIWVFINNKLVIDLGGNHMPAPGYVKLDTIQGLEEGQKYPINIFFCDRRASGSNVRITTNLYFSQKSGLYLDKGNARETTDICLQEQGGGSCSAQTTGGGTSDKCGCELAGTPIIYYMVKQGQDAKDPLNQVALNGSTPGCTEAGDVLSCFGSVTITKGCPGPNVQVKAQAERDLAGTWGIYAMANKGQDSETTLNMGRTSGQSNIIPAWGTIIDLKGNPVTSVPGYNSNGKTVAVASRLIPVGFINGSQVGDHFEADGEGTVNLVSSSLNDVNAPGSELFAYTDPAGTTKATFPVKIPENGVLVLYFTGSFEAEKTATYNINSGSKGEPFVLEVRQPKIEFVNADNSIIPQADRKGSDPRKGTSVAERNRVYTQTSLERKIAAFDPTVNPPVICETCTFDIIPQKNTKTYKIQSGTTEVLANELIKFTPQKINNGIGELPFKGVVEVENNTYAAFTVGGPSIDPSTLARWDSLQFKKPPYPVPQDIKIFDRTGDGIGDSLRIVYDRPFHQDSLLNKLLVVWVPGDTIDYGLAQLTNGEYTNAGLDDAAGRERNRAYWAEDGHKLIKGTELNEQGKHQDTIVITRGEGFSEGIKTMRYDDGGEVVLSWGTYVDEFTGAVSHGVFDPDIEDGISPIIILAEYEADEKSCGTSSGDKCTDKVYIYLSEPVKLADEGNRTDAARETFAYKLSQSLGTQDFVDYGHGADRSTLITVRWPNGRGEWPDAAKGDSSVILTYRSYIAESGADASNTPMAGDSVRILSKVNGASGNPLAHALMDLAGNYPNPNEIGRRFVGRGRANADKNLIASYDPTPGAAEENFKNKIRDRFGDSPAAIKEMENFYGDKTPPVGFLPVPNDWKGPKSKDSLSAFYPGTVGPVLWPDIKNAVENWESEGIHIPRDSIYIMANSFYHTSLGNYVAKSGSLKIKCTDPIFKINGNDGDCISNNAGFYLAWNLKDDKGRGAGTGAYVQVYNFHWEVKLDQSATAEHKKIVKGKQDKYPGSDNKTEMYGVRRVKGK